MILRVGNAALTVAIIVSLLWCTERAAFAYVDPGSGLFVCQSAGAVLAGTLFYLRRWLRRTTRPLRDHFKER